MRNNTSYPNQMKTRLFSEVEKALKAGVREVVLCLPGVGFRRRKIVAMHLMGDEVLFFDPKYNPECSYTLELGKSGSAVEADEVLPARKYAGHGMHALDRAWLAELFPEPKQRERVLGYTQFFSSFGGILVAYVNYWIVAHAGSFPAIVLPDWLGSLGNIGDPHAPWRYTLMSGIVPALPLAATAEPALKPNHPTHKSDAPTMLSTTLCGANISVP